MIRRTLRDLTPPMIWRLLGGNSRPDSMAPDRPLQIPESGPRALNYLIGEPVFVVPMERVRYPDGRRYTIGEHHFMQYYAEGLVALQRYYASHVPSSIFEKYFLEAPDGDAPSADGTPWFEYARARVYRGEGGLGPEHGLQTFGPVSDEKVQLEARRLDAVRASIARNGYVPALGGYVQGYFMVAGSGDWVFTVRGGFHRTSAMAYLGFETLPAQFFPRFPRFIEEADIALWPMVADGRLSEGSARSIFRQFFQSSIYSLSH